MISKAPRHLLIKGLWMKVGWETGLEPETSGTTIQRSNLLSYIHHEGMGLGVDLGVNTHTADRGSSRGPLPTILRLASGISLTS